MRVRKLLFRDFRSFRGRQEISFVDPLTDAVRPVTVLAGTNGSGKTTILEVIRQLLSFVIEPEPDMYPPIVQSMIRTSGDPEREKGFIEMTVELSSKELGRSFSTKSEPLLMQIMIGDLESAREEEDYDSWRRKSNIVYHLVAFGQSLAKFRRRAPLADELTGAVRAMQKESDLYGGLVYFPHDRQLGVVRGGPIEPPPEERQWVFRFSTHDRWQGSLDQLWTWQNYLDLEQSSLGRSNLTPFVAVVEEVLGKGRSITVSGGRALVSALWSKGDEKVRLDQLPSGEQQVLLLFGELARRRRKEAVVIIDEPEISLHPTLQRQVIHQLRKFAREWDMQLILATHSLEVLRAVHESERVILDQLEETPAASEGTK